LYFAHGPSSSVDGIAPLAVLLAFTITITASPYLSALSRPHGPPIRTTNEPRRDRIPPKLFFAPGRGITIPR